MDRRAYAVIIIVIAYVVFLFVDTSELHIYEDFMVPGYLYYRVLYRLTKNFILRQWEENRLFQ
jgi:hypothetical protein